MKENGFNTLKDYNFFQSSKRLCNWITSIGKQYKNLTPLLCNDKIKAEQIFEPKLRKTTFDKMFHSDISLISNENKKNTIETKELTEVDKQSLEKAIDCIRNLTAKNPLNWSSFETSEFLYSLGSDYWTSVFALKENSFTINRIFFLSKDDINLFERIVPIVDHRNEILLVVEEICNPYNWSSNSLSNWISSFGDKFKEISKMILKEQMDGPNFLNLDHKEIDLRYLSHFDRNMFFRIHLEFAKLNVQTNWGFPEQKITKYKVSNIKKEHKKDSKSLKNKKILLFDEKEPNELDKDIKMFLDEFDSKVTDYKQFLAVLNKWNLSLSVKIRKDEKLNELIIGNKLKNDFIKNNKINVNRFKQPEVNGIYSFNQIQPVTIPQIVFNPSIQHYPNYSGLQPYSLNLKNLQNNLVPIIDEKEKEKEELRENFISCVRNKLAENVNLEKDYEIFSLLSNEMEFGETNILIIGESDFSLTLSIIEGLQEKIQNLTLNGIKITINCFLSREKVLLKYENFEDNLNLISCHAKNIEINFSADYKSHNYENKFDHFIFAFPLMQKELESIDQIKNTIFLPNLLKSKITKSYFWFVTSKCSELEILIKVSGENKLNVIRNVNKSFIDLFKKSKNFSENLNEYQAILLKKIGN